MQEKAKGTTLPIVLPFTLGDSQSIGTVTLPLTLPFKFGSSGGNGTIRLPITLPMKFNVGDARKTSSIPTKITCVYANKKGMSQLPVSEYSNSGLSKLPVREMAWILVGLVLEENVIGIIKKRLLLIEDVRSRILSDIEMVNGTDVRIKWYGDKVPTVEVYKKMTTDDEYVRVGTYTWGLESAIITLGNSDYNLKLLGINNTGESEVITVGETTYKELDIKVDIPLNEKIYNIPIDNIDTYRIPINY